MKVYVIRHVVILIANITPHRVKIYKAGLFDRVVIFHIRRCDQIHVDSAGVRRDFFVAVVRTIVQCRPFPADAYPLEIVRVTRSDKTATFVERRERAANC